MDKTLLDPLRPLLILALAAAACRAPAPAPTATRAAATSTSSSDRPTATGAAGATAPPAAEPGPEIITGAFDYTNDIITTYYVEQAVALLDMHGFVIRDEEWELPVDSQVLGYLKLDEQNKHGEYRLQLPVVPSGVASDVNHDGSSDEGVQVFAIGYSPNLTGDPFSTGDDRSLGWPTYLASVKTDSENKDEVVGGKLVVWSAQAGAQFPTGFGADGLLFTADDPLGPLPAGYAIVDLDATPFGVSRDAQPQLELYEPKEAAIKDFSQLSYTDAFEKLFAAASTEWAFNDRPEKKVDWQALHAEVAPRVAEAQQNKDSLAFYRALKAFADQIPDGHTGVAGGQAADADFQAVVSGGYGFAIRELDDGRSLVVYVTAGGPAEAAGMKVGAIVSQFNGQPIAGAVDQVQPYAGPFSMEASRRYQQARYLLRAPAGTKADVTFANPGEADKTAALTAINERNSFAATSISRGADPNALPVEARLLTSGAGYIKINSNYDDLQLIIRLFERAVKQFTANGASGLIVDLRQNSGGAPLSLAGFFTDHEIPMGQLEYYSDKTGKFEPEGKPDKVTPTEHQYRFDKIAVMVGQACFSACEIEAYGFSQLPNAEVVGMYPSAGVEAEVSRGQFILPGGISFQLPTGRFLLPDGSLFLEGKGVPPTVRVPITAETLLSPDDVELRAAEDAVLGLSEGSLPIEGGPVLLSAQAANNALSAGARFLEDAAVENYGQGAEPAPGATFTYTINLSEDQRLVWISGWCATTATILQDNLKNIQVEFLVNGQPVQAGQFAVFDGSAGGQQCHYEYTVAYRWPSGATKLETQVTFKAPLNDGTADYPAGTRNYVYTVNRP